MKLSMVRSLVRMTDGRAPLVYENESEASLCVSRGSWSVLHVCECTAYLRARWIRTERSARESQSIRDPRWAEHQIARFAWTSKPLETGDEKKQGTFFRGGRNGSHCELVLCSACSKSVRGKETRHTGRSDVRSY